MYVSKALPLKIWVSPTKSNIGNVRGPFWNPVHRRLFMNWWAGVLAKFKSIIFHVPTMKLVNPPKFPFTHFTKPSTSVWCGLYFNQPKDNVWCVNELIRSGLIIHKWMNLFVLILCWYLYEVMYSFLWKRHNYFPYLIVLKTRINFLLSWFYFYNKAFCENEKDWTKLRTNSDKCYWSQPHTLWETCSTNAQDISAWFIDNLLPFLHKDAD